MTFVCLFCFVLFLRESFCLGLDFHFVVHHHERIENGQWKSEVQNVPTSRIDTCRLCNCSGRCFHLWIVHLLCCHTSFFSRTVFDCLSSFIELTNCDVFSIAVVAYLEDPWWRFWWFFDTYWELIYLAVITVICFVWRPTSNNRR